ncbi:hypothetical protein HanRHA438_Chr07g0313251 [Helianthus annuus]|uniref:Uncharacterized protein n=1 Tax=Helianthus annuus TaxID=4232 RepID=A0A9K3IM49_HELAN|nr:hypothetical protein HanXRQr2_Chr07g0303391 [Helianthus annuus]KAJ0557627.1 hypothetical protein HanIR_Chr07g0327271 [Helianthus annuus]KAJ0908691.1 hypothetical protein HanRHA438_Chr07g0313251 [Helianthus annuus]
MSTINHHKQPPPTTPLSTVRHQQSSPIHNHHCQKPLLAITQIYSIIFTNLVILDQFYSYLKSSHTNTPISTPNLHTQTVGVVLIISKSCFKITITQSPKPCFLNWDFHNNHQIFNLFNRGFHNTIKDLIIFICGLHTIIKDSIYPLPPPPTAAPVMAAPSTRRPPLKPNDPTLHPAPPLKLVFICCIKCC